MSGFSVSPNGAIERLAGAPRAVLVVLCCLQAGAAAATTLVVAEQGDARTQRRTYVIPYAFTSETTGGAVALTAAFLGYGQPQQNWLVNVVAGSDDAYALYLYDKDTRVPGTQRLFVDTRLIDGHWSDVASYRPGNPSYPDERAGAHDSDVDDYVESTGDDDYHRLKLRYVLPTGSGREGGVHTFRTRGGLLDPATAAGGWRFDPRVSGRMFLEAEPFYRKQDFEDEFDNRFEAITAGINWALEYDNTDWAANPSTGSLTRIEVSRDWGGFGSDRPWTALRFNFRKYWSLGETRRARQRVVAFNAWTSDVPTWNDGSPARPHRPPIFAGSTLGGLERLRAYPEARYNDRAALYYGVEYRHVPAWNPFPSIPLVNRLPIPWWELVVFAEVGRVAPGYSLGELHDDMDWDVGLGLRAKVIGIIVRMDIAQATDTWGVQMSVGHPW